MPSSPDRSRKKRNWSVYPRNYRPEWEKDPRFSPWLTRTSDDLLNEGKGECYCTLCHSTLRAHHDSLVDHHNGKTHQRKLKALPAPGNNQPRLERFGFEGNKDKNEKINDLKISVCVACHASTRSVDHIGEMMRTLGKGSPLQNLRLHRTKCTRLVTKVIVPTLMDDLAEDVGDGCFSIICDESTCNSTKKKFAFVIKYYSRKEKRMMLVFLGIVELTRQNAEALYTAFTAILRARGLIVGRCTAIGVDGAAAMCGSNHSLYTLLKERDCPNLMLVKCICHSLNKCASYASNEIPAQVEHMIRETRNWFSYSSNRKHDYSVLYQEICGTEPPQLVKLSETRWLAYNGAVTTHLAQFDVLKEHFDAITKRPRETCPVAESLAKYHKDMTNRLYLTFLKPVLNELTKYNLLFQSTYADVTKVFADLRVYVLSVGRKVIKDEAFVQGQPGMLRMTELEAMSAALNRKDSLKPLESVSYGASFRALAMRAEEENILTAEQIRAIKACCANFLVKLAKELVNRLPSSIADIEKLKYFAPKLVLARRGRPMFHSLPFNLLPYEVDADLLESQWNALGAMAFADICPLEDSLDTVDIVTFWGTVSELKNGAGERPFKELATAVLNLLTVPLSNAVVERVFSIMNIIKDRLRNRMCHETLNALLFVRLYLQAHKICCTMFEPTEAMLRRFNSRTMYDYQGEKEARRAARPQRRADPAMDNPYGAEDANVDPDDPGVAGANDAAQGAGDGEQEDQEEGGTIAFDPEAVEAVLDLLEQRDVAELFDF